MELVETRQSGTGFCCCCFFGTKCLVDICNYATNEEYPNFSTKGISLRGSFRKQLQKDLKSMFRKGGTLPVYSVMPGQDGYQKRPDGKSSIMKER